MAAAHQKLVLACLLGRIRVEFVESESLAQAFAILRPGFPRLKKEFALASVLQDLHAAACLESDQWLRGASSVTLVHRSTKDRNEWLAWDGQRRSMLLAEDVALTDETGHFQAAEDKETNTSDEARHLQHKCVSSTEIEAMAALICERMSPDATLSVCTSCPRLFETLRHGRYSIQNTIDPVTAGKPAFVGTCLMNQTVRLLKQLVQAFDFIPALLVECAELLASVQLNECSALQISQAEDLNSTAKDTNSESWLVLPRFVRQMQALEAEVRQRHHSATLDSHPLPPMRDPLWDELRALDALLMPFTWLFTLSETTTMTSAQYGLLWLWLGSVVQNSSEIPKHEQNAFLDHLLAAMKSLEPHHWASMLLDPRVHGAGLSATGKRKVKALVVHVAQELVGEEQLDPTSIARVNLLTQLGHYVEKTAQFADPIAWEMSIGNAPELFWKDYAQDAQELARVARFVATFQPHTRTATEYFRAPEQHSREAMDSEGWPDSFPVRRIRYHYLRNIKRDQRSDAVGKRFASLLRPFDPSAVLKAGEAVSPLNPTSAINFVDTLVAMDLQHSACPSDPTAARDETSVDASWFAWQSVDDQQAIERALQHSIITSVANQAAAV